MTVTRDIYFWNDEKEITATITEFIDGGLTITLHDEISASQADFISERVTAMIDDFDIMTFISISSHILYVSQKQISIELDEYDITIRYM